MMIHCSVFLPCLFCLLLQKTQCSMTLDYPTYFLVSPTRKHNPKHVVCVWGVWEGDQFSLTLVYCMTKQHRFVLQAVAKYYQYIKNTIFIHGFRILQECFCPLYMTVVLKVCVPTCNFVLKSLINAQLILTYSIEQSPS